MTKFNPETCTKIINLLQDGNYRKTAAVIAGITEETLCRWIKKGRTSKSKGKYYQFYQAVKKAEETAQAYHLQQIRKASENGSWQASAWYLERKCPDEWGRRQRVELEHSGELKQKVDVSIHDRIHKAKEYFDELDESDEGSGNGDNNQ